MKEKDLNTAINRSINNVAFSHKISDPMGGTGIQNPFDGLSVFQKKPWYWESKLLKGYQSFNFNKIEDHQIDNLTFIKNELGNNCHSLIMLGVYESRKYYDLFLFDILYIIKLKESGKNSLLKKELLRLKELNKEVHIIRHDNKYWIDNIDKLSEYIISVDNSDV